MLYFILIFLKVFSYGSFVVFLLLFLLSIRKVFIDANKTDEIFRKTVKGSIKCFFWACFFLALGIWL